jgi:hypothetical protein
VYSATTRQEDDVVLDLSCAHLRSPDRINMMEMEKTEKTMSELQVRSLIGSAVQVKYCL